MKTTLEHITETEAAISAIKSGAQEYRIGNRLVRRAELKVLLDELKALQHQYWSEQGSNVYVIKRAGNR